MKSLKECLAAPLDTTGMGNPGQLDADTLSEPITTAKNKKNVRKKTNKKSN